ncbi:MAG: hypothetical protein J7J61_07165 [Candidatus Hydrothermae bacterium]|nr:hypothetical protein [Candidatus Hydrothermae bacterium]
MTKEHEFFEAVRFLDKEEVLLACVLMMKILSYNRDRWKNLVLYTFHTTASRKVEVIALDADSFGGYNLIVMDSTTFEKYKEREREYGAELIEVTLFESKDDQKECDENG